MADNHIRPGQPYVRLHAGAVVGNHELKMALGHIRSLIRERLTLQVAGTVAAEMVETRDDYSTRFDVDFIVFTPASLQEYIATIKGERPTLRPFPSLIVS